MPRFPHKCFNISNKVAWTTRAQCAQIHPRKGVSQDSGAKGGSHWREKKVDYSLKSCRILLTYKSKGSRKLNSTQNIQVKDCLF